MVQAMVLRLMLALHIVALSTVWKVTQNKCWLRAEIPPGEPDR